MKDNQFLQAVLPAAKGGLGVSSACLLALSTFLASAVGAKATLGEIFGLEHEDEIIMMHSNFGLTKQNVMQLRKAKSKKI